MIHTPPNPPELDYGHEEAWHDGPPSLHRLAYELDLRTGPCYQRSQSSDQSH